MALPGLSFEIVRTSDPNPGIRADQTAIIALTGRGPVETPTLVHSIDEFTDQFGDVLPGALAALAAQGYYDNGGEQLIVTRFVPAEAASAIGALPVVGVDPARINQAQRTAAGQLDAAGAPTVFTISGLAPPVMPSDVNVPIVITVTGGGPVVAATITGVATGGASITVATGLPAGGFPPALPAAVVITLPATLPLVASGPGAFGDSVQIETTLSLRRRVKGNLVPSSPTTFQLSGLSPAVLPSDAGAPARLVAGTPAAVQWGTITAVGTGGVTLTFVAGPPAPGFPPSAPPPVSTVVEVYDRTFTLTILEPARADVVVSNLDLRDLAGMRARLAGTSVTIPPIPGEVPLVPGTPLPTPELPLAGVVSLSGGVDGLSLLPPDATTASATAAVVGATTHAPPYVLPFVAGQPGQQGNTIAVAISLTVDRFDLVELVSVGPDHALHLHGLKASDQGLPAQIVTTSTPPVTVWGKIQASAGGGHHLVLMPGAATVPVVPLPQPVALRVYAPTFTVTVSQTGLPAATVTGLDLRDLDGARALLAITSVTIPPGALDSMDVELPAPGSVTLAGGSDGTPSGDRIAAMASSFQRCIDALEIGDQPPTLPDIVIAPDLWSAIWATKGEGFLAFDGGTATGLADQMVLSAWRTSDRVVIVDPPLQGTLLPGAPVDLQPFTPADLVAWRAQRYAALGPSAATGPLVGLISAGTDFAATFTPWVQITAGGTYRGDDTLLVPPSGYVAGRMARTSRERGPWIATGNVSLQDVIGLDVRLSIQDQEALQAAGISPLRVELPMGATIQGVRSLSWPDRLAWGYLSTRRLFNFLRRALLPIGLSYVFEPNTPATWLNLRRDLTRFLKDLFLRGGLAGSKPSDGFYVKIDSTLNPQSAIDAGVMTAQIAVAPAIPLEFLAVRLVVQENTASVTEAPP